MIMNQIMSVPSLIEKFSQGDLHLSGLLHTWMIVFAAIVALCFLIGELTRNYSQVDKLWSLMPRGIQLDYLRLLPFPQAADNGATGHSLGLKAEL